MHLLRGMILLDTRQYGEAIGDFSEFLARNPSSPQAMYLLGHTYYLNEQFPQAIACYSQAIEKKPKNVKYLNSRGYTYILAGQYPAARADFAALLNLDARHASGWGNLGLIYAYEGNYPQAIELLEKAIRLDASQATLKILVAALKNELRGQRTSAINNYTSFAANAAKARADWLAEIRFAENRIQTLRSLRN